MPAYFIAFELEPSHELLGLQKQAASLHSAEACDLTPLNQFHCTLLFLGLTIDRDKVIKALQEIRDDPLLVQGKQLAYLKDQHHTSALVVLLDHPVLIKLHENLAKHLSSEHGQNFTPHVTLLRTDESKKPLPRIAPTAFTLKNISLFEAHIEDRTASYTKMYTQHLDFFEREVFSVLEDLKSLHDLPGLDLAVIYGSTASGKIKKPVHDIDLYLFTQQHLFPLHLLQQIKTQTARIAQQHESSQLQISSWCVGLGKVFSMHKLEAKNKPYHLGIEFHTESAFTRVDTGLTLQKIRDKGLKVLFGDPEALLLDDELEKGHVKFEYTASLILCNILNMEDTSLYDHFFPAFVFSGLSRKHIPYTSKQDALEKFAVHYPNVSVPSDKTSEHLLRFYCDLLEALP